MDTKPIKLQIKDQSIEVQKAFQSIEKYPKEYVICHNDLNPQNIFFAYNVKLIDWEYAGMNDRYFDLACVCVEFNLNEIRQRVFLKHYFKDEKIIFDKFEAYKAIYRALCKQWFENN